MMSHVRVMKRDGETCTCRASASTRNTVARLVQYMKNCNCLKIA